MAKSEDSQKRTGPVLDLALCRCCRTIKKCRLLTKEYEWMGTKEVYSDMIMDCFGLLLSHLDDDSDEKERCICATCVLRLREATAFRRQLLYWEEALLQANWHSHYQESAVVKAEPVNVSEDEAHWTDGDHQGVSDVEDTKPLSELRTDRTSDSEERSNIKSIQQRGVSSSRRQVSGSRRQVSGSRRQAAGSRRQVAGSRRQVSGSRRQAAGSRRQVAGSRRQVSGSRRQAAGSRRQVAGSRRQVASPALHIATTHSALKQRLIHDINKLKSTLTEHERVDRQTGKHKGPPSGHGKRAGAAAGAAEIIVTCSYAVPFHARASNYHCFYCMRQYVDPRELREHTLAAHDPAALYATLAGRGPTKLDVTRVDCRLCPASVGDLAAFREHASRAHGRLVPPAPPADYLAFRLTLGELECVECGRAFPYFDSLKRHTAEHFGTWTCETCGACFLEETSLRSHARAHRPAARAAAAPPAPCHVCGKTLATKYSRRLHVLTVHERTPTVECWRCGASFMSHALRNRHLIEAHADPRTFPCRLCDKVYNRRKTLMEHHRRTHLRVLRHRCELCDRRFYLPSRLAEHMATHTGERRFRCEHCGKTYPRLKSLREHARTHSAAPHAPHAAAPPSDTLDPHITTHDPTVGNESGLG